MLENLKRIPDMTWTPGIPKVFENLQKEEVSNMFLQSKPMKYHEQVTFSGSTPSSWDWTTENAACMNKPITAGDCFADQVYSAVSIMGELRCIHKKDAKLVGYSYAYEVTCATGCYGGEMSTSWQYLKYNGVPTAECVPNNGTTTCPVKCSDGSALQMTKITGFVDVCNNTNSMEFTIQQTGPINTAFAVYEDFMYYTGGIYKHQTGSLEGYTALEIVGYGVDNDTMFWKIRNSYGPYWGESGYFRVLKGVNECDVESQCYQVGV